MITHFGWAVFIGDGDDRQYLEALIAGRPKFAAHPKDAVFFDEYEARQTCAILVRMGHSARVQYIPFSVRRLWNRNAEVVWKASYAR